MNTHDYLRSIPYESHYVHDVIAHGWVARHLASIGESALTVCPECGQSDFAHLAGCSIAVQMAPHREGLARAGSIFVTLGHPAPAVRDGLD